MAYVAGWNAPGYVPDMDTRESERFDDTREFERFDDAREFLISELSDLDDSARAIELIRIYDVPGYFEVMGPDGFIYWVDED